MSLGTDVGLGPGDTVLDGDPAPPWKGHSTPHFSAHVYCGQTAGWIRIPLGTEVGLGPGEIVRRKPSSPHGMGHRPPPLFGPCLLWPNGRPCQQLQSSCLKLAARIRHYAGTTYDGRTISDDRATTGLKLRRRFGRRAY